MSLPPSTTRRFRLDLAYDGRPFEGWQSQAGGNTVQDVLLGELRAICPEIATVQGSGRTDAGVSAEGQVAHFDAPAEWRMGGLEWLRALNAKLPGTIRVMGCAEVDPSFHARFSAGGKTYRYRIGTGEVLSPFDLGLAWHRRGLAGDDGIAGTLAAFEGEHDFRAFSAKRRDGKDGDRDTVRTISEARLRRDGDTLELRFTGNGFLYRMVRFLVGTAVHVAEGKVDLDKVRELLSGGHPEGSAPYCAPASGLVLESVFYPAESE